MSEPYSREHIKVVRLTVEAVRRRPGMYMGDTEDGSGLSNMIWEVLSNSVDEHLAGRCTRVAVQLAADGSIIVDDDGGGIPVHEVGGVPFVETIFTTYHDTPTSDGHAPHVHLGPGIGVFGVCALSAWLEVKVFRDGEHFEQRFERGRAATPLRRIESTNRRGARVTFLPDASIFRPTAVDPGPVLARLRELAYFLPKLTLTFVDRREHRFNEPEGLVACVRAKLGDQSVPALLHVCGAEGEISVEAAAGWDSRPGSPTVESFANLEPTTQSGTHVRGFFLGLIAGLRRIEPQLTAGKSRKKLEAVLSRGLRAVVCVRLLDPTYGAPTKARLTNPEVSAVVEACVAAAFVDYLVTHHQVRERFVSLLDNSRT